VSATVSFTVQTFVFTLQSPLQPVNACPGAGFAVRVAVAPALKCWTQVLAGPVLAQVPAEVETAPLPWTPIVKVPAVPPPLNVAETLFAALIGTEHVLAAPEQAPPQPLKVAPSAGVSVSVTVVPELNVALHALAPLPQLMLFPVTRPEPETVTVSGNPLV